MAIDDFEIISEDCPWRFHPWIDGYLFPKDGETPYFCCTARNGTKCCSENCAIFYYMKERDESD